MSANWETSAVAAGLSSVQSFSCVRLCNPMDCSMPGLPVHHQLLEFIQTRVHWVSDALQPSPPLSSPSPAFNLSQHRGLFKFWCYSMQKKKKGKLSYILWSIQDKMKTGSQLKVPKDVSWLYYESVIHWILYVLGLTFAYPLVISGKKRIILRLH